jgi:hypothetical protein
MGGRLLPTGFTKMNRSIVANQNGDVEFFELLEFPLNMMRMMKMLDA